MHSSGGGAVIDLVVSGECTANRALGDGVCPLDITDVVAELIGVEATHAQGIGSGITGRGASIGRRAQDLGTAN